jgi:hypothetical protein
MTKNEALEKAKEVIDNDKRAVIIENRIARLEKMMTEDADDPAVILMDAVDDGYITWETLGRELIAQMSVDELWSVCDALDLVEESKKASDKPVKNEDIDDDDMDVDPSNMTPSERNAWAKRKVQQMKANRKAEPQLDDEDGYNSYDICQEILDNYGATDWIGESDIDEYLDNYYSDMSDEDRWFVHDRMEKFVNVDPYRSVQDDDDEDEDWDEDDEDFESKKRPARRAKNESTKRPAKRSLVSRYKK